jgi:hypothetical protein
MTSTPVFSPPRGGTGEMDITDSRRAPVPANPPPAGQSTAIEMDALQAGQGVAKRARSTRDPAKEDDHENEEGMREQTAYQKWD